MSEDSVTPDASEPQQAEDPIEEGEPECLLDRRALLGLGLKWSKAALAAILVGGVVATEEKAEAFSAWVDRRGGRGWDNARPGWVNRRPRGSWVNRPGGNWVNRRRPGSSWVDRPGGSWMNRR